MYSLLFSYAFSAIGNFGILSRERVQLYPLLVVLVCIPIGFGTDTPTETEGTTDDEGDDRDEGAGDAVTKREAGTGRRRGTPAAPSARPDLTLRAGLQPFQRFALSSRTRCTCGVIDCSSAVFSWACCGDTTVIPDALSIRQPFGTETCTTTLSALRVGWWRTSNRTSRRGAPRAGRDRR